MEQQADLNLSLPTEKNIKLIHILTAVGFFVTGFQTAIYGILTVPIADYFKVSPFHMTFLFSIGLWGQILATSAGAWVLIKLKGRSTLLLAATIMIIASITSILTKNMTVFVIMTFLCNISVGLINVSTYYLIAGTVKEKGQVESKFSILTFFFLIGIMLSPFVNGFFIEQVSWKMIFILVSILFLVFTSCLIFFNFKEQNGLNQEKVSTPKKRTIISLQLILVSLAALLFMCVIQIINFFILPYMQVYLKLTPEFIGAAFTVYTAAQIVGCFVFGKFLLDRVKTHRFIITSLICLIVGMIFFVYINMPYQVILIMIWLGISASCIYPSILGYALDQTGKVTEACNIFCYYCWFYWYSYWGCSLQFGWCRIRTERCLFYGGAFACCDCRIDFYCKQKKIID